MGELELAEQFGSVVLAVIGGCQGMVAETVAIETDRVGGQNWLVAPLLAELLAALLAELPCCIGWHEQIDVDEVAWKKCVLQQADTGRVEAAVLTEQLLSSL